MEIEKYFPALTKTTFCGETIYGSYAGYPIFQNREKQIVGTVNGIARMFQNLAITNEDIEYSLKVNSDRLGLTQEGLMSMVLDSMNNSESEEANPSDTEQ